MGSTATKMVHNAQAVYEIRQSMKFKQLGIAVLDYLIFICYVLGGSTGMHLFSWLFKIT
jgi:hypothetical protein